MKKYSALYYLLFVLIIMGAFASMAQNAYGLKICGIASLGFAIIFLNEIFFTTPAEEEQSFPAWMIYGELGSLFIIALIFFFKNFAMDSPFFSPLLFLSMVVLLLLLSYQAVLQIQRVRLQIKLVIVLALYYGSIIVFILSFLTGILAPDLANELAIVAMIVSIGFVVFALIFKKLSFKDETISAWQFIRLMKNKSVILLISCILIYGYNLLYSAGTLPSLYHGTLPNGYQHLVELSIAGKDQRKPVEFKARYEEFVRKYSEN